MRAIFLLKTLKLEIYPQYNFIIFDRFIPL